MASSRAPILLVDDDDDTRSLLRETLQADGHAIVEATNGKAALDVLMGQRGSEPCLIVLDLQMPVMSGWEFLAIIKSYTRLARIPVVVVSGTEPHAETLARQTIAAWIQKPYEVTRLVSVIRKHARDHCV